ncbi:MAG: hypothetical protein ACP5NQ_07170 [Vulcanisaeta sp.]
MGIRVWAPRAGLTTRSRLRTALYLGFAALSSFPGKLEVRGAYVWRQNPAREVGGLGINVKLPVRNLDDLSISDIAEKASSPDAGVAVEAYWDWGGIEAWLKLIVFSRHEFSHRLLIGPDMDALIWLHAYANVDGKPASIEDFVSLLRYVSNAHEAIRDFANSFMRYLNYGVAVRTTLGIRVYPLAKLLDRVRMSRGEDFNKIGPALPLYYGRFLTQFVADAYRLGEAEYTRLTGSEGLRRVYRDLTPLLLGRLGNKAELLFIDRMGVQLSRDYILKVLERDPGRVGRLGVFIIPRPGSNPVDNLVSIVNDITNLTVKAYKSVLSIDRLKSRGVESVTWSTVVSLITEELRNSLINS